MQLQDSNLRVSSASCFRVSCVPHHAHGLQHFCDCVSRCIWTWCLSCLSWFWELRHWHGWQRRPPPSSMMVRQIFGWAVNAPGCGPVCPLVNWLLGTGF